MSAGSGDAAGTGASRGGGDPAAGDAPPRVVLVGATGFTGGLVTRELASSGLPFLLTSRSPGALRERAREAGGAPTRTVDVTEPSTLAACLRTGDVVIDCAGPFTELGEPVVRCSVEAGAHYLDTTGEQPFMKRVEDRYHRPAREAGVAVVNAMAFEYALGDAAAGLAARGLERPLARLDVVYGWRAGAASTTPGTRASILRILGRGGWALAGGEWSREPVARRRRRVRLPGGAELQALSFPAGEIVTVPRHVEVDTVRGWIVAGGGTARLARLLSPLLPAAARLLEPVLDPLARRGPAGPSEEERRRGRFDVVVTAEGASGGRRTIAVGGRDPYGITASLIVRGARTLLSGGDDGAGTEDDAGTAGGGAARPAAEGDPRRGAGRRARGPAGVLAPSELIDPAALLDGLKRFDVEWGEAPEAGPAA